MTNQEILEEILQKIGRNIAAETGPKVIISRMNQLYKEYNLRFRGAVKNTTTITFAEGETDTTETVPSDWIEPYIISPQAVWRPPVVFDNTENGTYTIDNGVIKFALNAAGFTFTIAYFSKGKELVVLDPGQSATNSQVTSPQWRDDLHRLLVLAVATRESNEYRMYQQDLVDRTELERQLKKFARLSLTSANPIIGGPEFRRNSIETDKYSPDYDGNYFV